MSDRPPGSPPQPSGPRLARWLVGRLVPREHAADVVGDLEERFARRRARRGRAASYLWYWRQSLQFLVGARAVAEFGREARLRHSPRKTPMAGLIHDLRYAARALLRQPTFAIVAVVTLALGVGANTAIFSVIDGLVLRPLDYPESERLFRLYHFDADAPAEDNVVTAPDYLDYRERVDAFAQLAALYTYNDTGFDLVPRGGGPARRLRSLYVSSDYFAAYGVPPARGRAFMTAEETDEARVAVISDRLWRDVMEARPDALGETLLLSGRAWEVIGVMPPGFADPIAGEIDVWIPQDLVPAGMNNRDNYFLTVVGRLAPEATFESAQAELETLVLELAEAYPNTNRDKRSRIRPLQEDLLGAATGTLWTLLGASAFVLLIACANVANLQIGRSVARRRELAVRSALGSGRGRLVRQLLAEAMLLAAAGAALGLVVASRASRGLLAQAPERLTRINDVPFDLRIFAFAAGIAVVTACLSGVLPALRAVRGNLEAALRDGGRADTGGVARSRLRGVLVVSEVALAIALLVGAGLLLRSFALMQGQDLGVTDDPVLTFELRLPSARYPEAPERLATHRAINERIAALPGVVATGAMQWLPATGPFNIWGFFVQNPEAEKGYDAYNANIRIVSGDAFAASGVTVLAGRAFDGRDVASQPPVAIVNRMLVERAFPDGRAIGRRIRVAGADREIVGVVSDVAIDLRDGPYPTVHFPHEQWADRNWGLFQMVRTDGAVAGLMASIRSEIAAVDAGLVPFNVRALEDAIGSGAASTRFTLLLLAIFAALAAVLAAIGIYGVLAFGVGQRRREIGIRLALGAKAGQVRRQVVGQGLALVAVGTVGGLAVAALTGRLLSALLYGVAPADPIVLGSVVGAILVIALVAAWIPARRASRVEPVRALR